MRGARDDPAACALAMRDRAPDGTTRSLECARPDCVRSMRYPARTLAHCVHVRKPTPYEVSASAARLYLSLVTHNRSTSSLIHGQLRAPRRVRVVAHCAASWPALMTSDSDTAPHYYGVAADHAAMAMRQILCDAAAPAVAADPQCPAGDLSICAASPIITDHANLAQIILAAHRYHRPAAHRTGY